MRRTMLVALVAASVTALVGCKSNQSTMSAAIKPVAILSQSTGSDPAFKLPDVTLINSAKELAATGAKLDVKVNWDTQSLIILAVGEQKTTGYTGKITGVQQGDGVVYVQGVVDKPATTAAVKLMDNCPYVAVVTDKVEGTVRPEID